MLGSSETWYDNPHFKKEETKICSQEETESGPVSQPFDLKLRALTSHHAAHRPVAQSTRHLSPRSPRMLPESRLWQSYNVIKLEMSLELPASAPENPH